MREGSNLDEKAVVPHGSLHIASGDAAGVNLAQNSPTHTPVQSYKSIYNPLTSVMSDIDILVEQYKKTPSKNNSGVIYAALLPEIKRLTVSLSHNLPYIVSDELVSLAGEAFVYSLERHDSSKGCFKNYFMQRAKGNMFDYLRQVDYLPRRSRSLIKKWNSFSTAYTATHGLPADESVLRKYCEDTGVSITKLRAVIRDTEHGTPFTSIDEKVSQNANCAESMTLGETLADTQPLPGDLLMAQDALEEIRYEVESLPAKHRYVATSFMSGDSVNVIAERLQVTRSRVWQMFNEMGDKYFARTKKVRGYKAKRK